MTEPANNPPTETAHADGAAFDSAELVAMLARWRETARDWRVQQMEYRSRGKVYGDWYCGLLAQAGEEYARDIEKIVGRACLATDPKLSDGGAWRGACPTVERREDAQM